MKYLKILNTIAILIPIAFLISGFWYEENIILAIPSFLITGLIQIGIAVIYFFTYPGETPIKIYFIGLALFIFLLFLNLCEGWYWILPPVLLVLLSYIVYSKKSGLSK